MKKLRRNYHPELPMASSSSIPIPAAVQPKRRISKSAGSFSIGGGDAAKFQLDLSKLVPGGLLLVLIYVSSSFQIQNYSAFVLVGLMLIPIGVAILLASRRVFKIVDRFPLLSLDVPRSCIKALVSIQQLAIILRQCLHTKKKETMEK
ncbi:hypothetical protein C5167_026616, partial [Papaver somniferum]